MRQHGLRFGPYVTPICVPGTMVECEVRGAVTVVGLSAGPIPWPMGTSNGVSELIVFKGLSKALRRESAQAVADAWGVEAPVVEQWQAQCHGPTKRKKQAGGAQPIAWKPADDELICRLTLEEAARLTGRTITAIRKRRRALNLPDARFTEHKAKPLSIEEQARSIVVRVRGNIALLHDSLMRLRHTYAYSAMKRAYWSGLMRSERKKAASETLAAEGLDDVTGYATTGESSPDGPLSLP